MIATTLMLIHRKRTEIRYLILPVDISYTPDCMPVADDKFELNGLKSNNTPTPYTVEFDHRTVTWIK